MEIAVPEEDVLQQTQNAERLCIKPVSVKRRGRVTRIMYRLPYEFSLSP